MNSRKFPKAITLATLFPKKFPKTLKTLKWASACWSADVRQCNWRADNASLEERFAYVQCRQRVTRGAASAPLSANLGLADNDLHAKAAPHRPIGELPVSARSFSLLS